MADTLDESCMEVAPEEESAECITRKRPLSNASNTSSEPKRLPKMSSQGNGDPEGEAVTLQFIASKLAGIDKRLEKLDTMEVEMVALKNSLAELQKAHQYTHAELKGTSEEVVSLKAEVDEIQVQQNSLNSEMNKLKLENKELKEKMLKQEIYSRRENVIIDGIEETEREDCLSTVTSMFADLDGVGHVKLERCHRLGRKSPHQPVKPRPIIARFLHHTEKVKVMKKWSSLKQKGIFIRDDFPIEVIARRAKLKPVLNKAKTEDDNAKLIMDKLLFKGNLYTADNIQNIPIDLSDIGTQVEESKVLFKGRYSPLSNLFVCCLKDGEKTFHSSEQLYQYRRALDANNIDIAVKVLDAKDSYQAMTIGKQMNTNEQWTETKGMEIMRQVVRIKSEQVPEFRNLLTQHADKTFFEASSNRVWGIGVDLYSPDIDSSSKWLGKNLLGKVFEQVSHEL